MVCCPKSLPLLLLLSIAALSLRIDGDTVWVVAGEIDGQAVFGDSLELPAYNLALRDLQNDWYKVFGYSPAIHKLAGATASVLQTPEAKRTYSKMANQFCHGNYHPNVTIQATVEACQVCSC
jgi:hypothetical protein